MLLERDTLTPREVEAFLSSELPGFASRISVADRQSLIVVEVRGPVHFSGRVTIDRGSFAVPVPSQDWGGGSEALAEHVVQLVRETRNHAIEQLGLRAEINQQVKEQVTKLVAESREGWKQTGYAEGMRAAIAAFVAAGINPPQEPEQEDEE